MAMKAFKNRESYEYTYLAAGCVHDLQAYIIIIMAGMAVFYVAGYLVEERRIMACNYCFPTRTMV